jgi:hypothetical protein
MADLFTDNDSDLAVIQAALRLGHGAFAKADPAHGVRTHSHNLT